MKFNVNVFFIVSILILFTSCKKYDEGGLNIRAKSHLLANGGKWFVESYEVRKVNTNEQVNITFSNIESERNLIIYKVKDDPDQIIHVKNVYYNSDSYTFKFLNRKQYIQVDFVEPPCGICSATNCPIYFFTPIVTLVNGINQRSSVVWKIEKLTQNQIILTSKLEDKTYLIKLIAK